MKINPTRSQSGFSLIELMLVVAIIAALSVIAIPNFQYFSSKARSSEGQSAVTAMYTAEKMWFAQYKYFTYCLYEAGYEPSEGGRRYYTSGFLTNTIAAKYGYDPSTHQNCNFGSIAWGGAWRNDGIFQANIQANPAAGWITGGMVQVTSDTTFDLIAFGSISSANLLDVWYINDSKVIKHGQTGY